MTNRAATMDRAEIGQLCRARHNRPYAEFRIMPRKVTAAADGRYRVRYHLGIIRRTDLDVNVPNCDLQLEHPALALLRTPQMAASLGLATLENAETLGVSPSAFLPNYGEDARALISG